MKAQDVKVGDILGSKHRSVVTRVSVYSRDVSITILEFYSDSAPSSRTLKYKFDDELLYVKVRTIFDR